MEEQTSQNLESKPLAALEALLFIYGEPLQIKKIAKILKAGDDVLDETAVKTAVEQLQRQLENNGRGLSLVINDDAIQLVTKKEFQGLLQEVIKEELHESLTPAALETLAIIAYTGPIPRSAIDYIRGVNSTFMLRNLLLRGLIDRSPDPKRGNAFIYKASFEFMRHLGLEKIDDLPEYQKFREVVEKLQAAN